MTRAFVYCATLFAAAGLCSVALADPVAIRVDKDTSCETGCSGPEVVPTAQESAPAVVGRRIEPDSVDRSNWKLKDAAAAKKRALCLVGLDEALAAGATLVTVENDQTPFLADKINGREVWLVTVPNWSVQFKSAPPDVKDRYQRTLDVLVDPVTGHILKLQTRWPADVPEPQDTVEPDAKEAERQIFPEKYHGFPAESPGMTFMEALEASDAWGAMALEAKRIDAVWTLWSPSDAEPRAVWIITLWCVPPLPAFHGDVALYLLENFRIVVDPVNKRWIRTSQKPHRILVKDRRKAPAVVGRSVEPESVDRSGWKLKDATAAKKCALGLVGLREDRASSTMLVKVENDQTPFLADKLNGREVWQVTVPEWSIELSLPDGKKWRERRRRALDVLIDPVTGQVLKLETRWPEDEVRECVEPDAKEAQARMGREKYEGCPAEPPPISLMEALEAIQTGGGQPSAAKQIEGLWVLWSYEGKDARPMWVITLRGIPPIPPIGFDVPMHPCDINHMRFIIDPIKRKWVQADSSPQPDPVGPTQKVGG